MGKLTVHLFASLDGFTADRGDLPGFGPEQTEFTSTLHRSSNALLMGRATYEIFAASWPTEEDPLADWMNGVPKFVFSKSLPEPLSWNNATLNRGDIAVEVPKLKERYDLMVTGSPKLVGSLLRSGLVDRLVVQLYPVILGPTGDRRLFDDYDRANLGLTTTTVLDNNVVALDCHPTP